MLLRHINQNVLSNIMINALDSSIIVNDLGFNLQLTIAENLVS